MSELVSYRNFTIQPALVGIDYSDSGVSATRRCGLWQRSTVRNVTVLTQQLLTRIPDHDLLDLG